MLKIFFFCIALSSSSIFCKIAIMAYGSLVKRPNHSVTGAKLLAGPFKRAPFTFPIGLSLLAHTDRITAVIDNEHGIEKNGWYAVSNLQDTSAAIQNLAAREGACYLGDEKGYDTSHIFYIKKIDEKELSPDEQIVTNFPDWIIRNDPVPRQQLDISLVNDMIIWAQLHKFDALIWTSCPIVAMSEHELIQLLLTHKILLKHAQDYVRLLPDGPQSRLEKAIVAGKKALQKLL